MERKDILKGLANFTERLTSQTYLETYREQGRSSLLNEGLGTRANSIWKMAEYVVLHMDDSPDIPIERYINGWKELCKNYKNQYLLIEKAPEEWEMYDSYGRLRGGNDYIKNYLQEKAKRKDSTNKETESPTPKALIYYGAPGTGKSHLIKDLLKSIPQENIFRTTFHPDSDYSTFVGAYKPTMEKLSDKMYTKEELIGKVIEITKSGATYPILKFATKYWRSLKSLNNSDKNDVLQACGKADTYETELNKGVAIGEEYFATSEKSQIVYSFVPQTFLKAYIQAYRKPKERIYLIIEEINRGNCAQIFGDIFQLLDRAADGKSEYSIEADVDLRIFLEDKLGCDNPGIASGKLCLPPNLYILATMNTSDQSLFPMDSAFKRRWSWEYVPINAECPDSQFNITIGDGPNKKTYKWASFLTLVNERIHKLSDSEDKQMGNFFIKDNIGVEEFKSKVMFYLWSEVCKEYEHAGSFFKYKAADGKEVEFTFNSLFPTNESTNAILQRFMTYLGVEEATPAATE